ncbi:hypothetical protein [Laribacter hongkongensis]|uniref:hypothetical protein n=1 Tax=Laribacter hongkongensis TaxID=168471 RepID=UPI001EFC8C27|nr:hypothetical protein [Laribacter hongkongensis]MCG9079154.1 hypothetical protein [Laribacter hongkongensis]
MSDLVEWFADLGSSPPPAAMPDTHPQEPTRTQANGAGFLHPDDSAGSQPDAMRLDEARTIFARANATPEGVGRFYGIHGDVLLSLCAEGLTRDGESARRLRDFLRQHRQCREPISRAAMLALCRAISGELDEPAERAAWREKRLSQCGPRLAGERLAKWLESLTPSQRIGALARCEGHLGELVAWAGKRHGCGSCAYQRPVLGGGLACRLVGSPAPDSPVMRWLWTPDQVNDCPDWMA